MTTNEILNQIPQIANTFNTQTTPPTAINIGGVRPSIRYNPAQNITGGSSTLLLLDGHNLVGISGLATAPDAGIIPTIVLRQVDVLPDGASSIYGANAITGVINFVTRETYQGFQANASVGVADGYSSFNASMMAGTDWGTGGAYLAFEHKENTYLFARDRDYTKMDLTPAAAATRAPPRAVWRTSAPAGSAQLRADVQRRAPHARFAKGQCHGSVCRPESRHQRRFVQSLRHQLLPLAISQGRAEFLLRPVPSARSCKG